MTYPFQFPVLFYQLSVVHKKYVEKQMQEHGIESEPSLHFCFKVYFCFEQHKSLSNTKALNKTKAEKNIVFAPSKQKRKVILGSINNLTNLKHKLTKAIHV